MDAQQIRGLRPMLARFLKRFDDCFARKDTRATSRSMSTANSPTCPARASSQSPWRPTCPCERSRSFSASIVGKRNSRRRILCRRCWLRNSWSLGTGASAARAIGSTLLRGRAVDIDLESAPRRLFR